MTPTYKCPRPPAKAIDPVIRALQSTLGHRYYGKVTVVVDCVRGIDDFCPIGEVADRLNHWVDIAVLSRMTPGATLEIVHR